MFGIVLLAVVLLFIAWFIITDEGDPPNYAT